MAADIMALKDVAAKTGFTGFCIVFFTILFTFLNSFFRILPGNCFFDPRPGCGIVTIIFFLAQIGLVLLFFGGGGFILASIIEKINRKQ